MVSRRVLIVDDSFFMRTILSDVLMSCSDVVVVGTASNGREAVEKVMTLNPDVVTMDVDMPRMGGLEAVERIMSVRPTPIVLVSAHAAEGADVTLRALELGAVDFIAKPQVAGGIRLAPDRSELIEKVLAAANAKVKVDGVEACPDAAGAPLKSPSAAAGRRILITIGASAGGPKALLELFSRLPTSFECPMVVVQHMPSGFTKSLAERLDHVGGPRVRQAEAGDRLEQGVALVAPGGVDMEMCSDDQGPRLAVSEPSDAHRARPSIDLFMGSAVKHFNGQVLAVVLSGMGKDGTHGSRLVRQAGGRVLAQDEATSIVYGMPKSVQEAGVANRQVPIHTMGREILKEIDLMGDGIDDGE